MSSETELMTMHQLLSDAVYSPLDNTQIEDSPWDGIKNCIAPIDEIDFNAPFLLFEAADGDVPYNIDNPQTSKVAATREQPTQKETHSLTTSPTDSQSPKRKARGRPRQSSSTGTAEDQLSGNDLRRKRNCVAARKCRERKRGRTAELEAKLESLEFEKSALLQQVKALQYQLITLQTQGIEGEWEIPPVQ